MFFSAVFVVLYVSLVSMFLKVFFGGGLLLDFFLFEVGGLTFSFCVIFDYVSLGFISCVFFISGLVFFYSVFYMQGTVDTRRFYWLVFGFVLSMAFLVFSGNFLLTMVGWDGLGLTSFCLVIFYSNHSSLESGLVTVFSNRVGDVFFLVCFFFFLMGGTFSLELGSKLAFSIFFLFLFLGAITKSAQVPFSAWLPAAMAAPTPVSSLVHSSTLVTAGVYVLIRFFYVFYFLSWGVFKLIFISTMLVAGACANLEKDFKKVVAMSTLSQLGMMLFILSVGVWVLSFLHMIIHAFFKSMLFLSTGSLMSHLGGGQDSRFYGGSIFSFGASLFFLVSCACLAGFPFYIGFYSKDFIILGSSSVLGAFLYISFLLGCLFTIFYSLRLFFLGYTFWVNSFSLAAAVESWDFIVPVSFLYFKGWLLGGGFYWLFLGEGVTFMFFFDLFVGLLLLGLGITFHRLLYFSYNLLFYLSLISFLRWFSGVGSSFSLLKMGWHKWDSSWMEAFGGQGVYLGLINGTLFAGGLGLVSLGFILLVVSLSFYLLFF